MSGPLGVNPYQSPQYHDDIPRVFPLGEMSLSDILSRGLAILFSRMTVFLPIQLAASLPMIALVIGAGLFSNAFLSPYYAGGVALLTVVTGAIAGAAVLKVIEQEHIDQRVGVGEALSFALSRAIPLILTSIIFGLVIFLGMLLLVIPGIIAAVVYIFASQACVLEKLGPIQAMDRSEKLTKGYRWRVFGIVLVVGVLSYFVNKGCELTMEGVFPIVSESLTINRTNLVVFQLIPLVVNMLVTTYGNICLTLTYFNLRVRKESFDVAISAKSVSH